MSKVHLYEISLKNADAPKTRKKNTATAQEKLSNAFRTAAEQKIEEAGLTAEFAYVCMRRPVTDDGLTHHVYASTRVIGIIRQINNVKKIERAMVSAHALTKTI